jgi:hypothetical protein
MKSIYFFISLLLILSNCSTTEETQKHTKSEWLTSFFNSVETYDAFKAVSYWHEDFDDTHFKVNSSEESLQTFKNLVADDLYSSSCIFDNNKLIPLDNKKYFASFPDFCGEEDCVSGTRITNYENLINKEIAWAYFSNNWGTSLLFPQENVTAIINANRTPFIRLMPRSEFEIYTQDPIWKLTDIINGTHDLAITNWANHAKLVPANLLVEFGTEMNGFWFSWNGKYYGAGTKDKYGDTDYPDGPEIFRDAYRHIIDLCNDAGANNLTWFFHFDVNNDPDEWWNDPIYYYPGDAYIDWLGVSTYGAYKKNEEYQETAPKQLLEKAYLKFKEISQDKPYAILEFGVTEL